MQPTSRIVACRAGFVLFCLLPTLVVGGWIVRRSLPNYRLAQQAEWQHVLSQRLGLSVTLGELSYPSPNVALLRELQLANPETGETIAEIREVEVARTAAGWKVEASQPVIDVGQASQLAATLHDRLLREFDVLHNQVEFSAAEVTLERGQQAVTLVRMAGQFQADEEAAPRLVLNFSLPEAPADAQPLMLAVVRNRQVRPPVTRWQIDTAGAALPCWIGADALPQLARLGPDARFAGHAAWLHNSDGLHAQLEAALIDVDLNALVSEQFPHLLSGVANVRLQPAMIERGQLVDLRGSIQAANGYVSPSLLAAAEKHLGIAVPDAVKALGNQPVTFRQLSLGFHLNDRQLQLTGGCDPTRDGIALANAAGPIVEVPPRHATASVNLLRTLLPESDWQVPATRQTGSLAALLPAPDASPQTTARRTGHTPTRLAPAGPVPSTGAPVRQPR